LVLRCNGVQKLIAHAGKVVDVETAERLLSVAAFQPDIVCKAIHGSQIYFVLENFLALLFTDFFPTHPHACRDRSFGQGGLAHFLMPEDLAQ